MVRENISSPPSNPDELNKETRPEDIWNESSRMIDKDVISKALNICHETYLGSQLMTDEEWSNGFNNRASRCVFGCDEEEGTTGTRCVLLYEPTNANLFIGFRGSKDKDDWLTNLDIKLANINDGGDAKVHRGFKKRSDAIFEELSVKIMEVAKPDHDLKIITTGHSLGAAISQLIHIKLYEKFKEEWKCKFVNVTFATPMVGNYHLRKKLHTVTGGHAAADSMYHFALAEDVVPPSLFANEMYDKLPWWATRKGIDLLLKILGQVPDEDVKLSIDIVFKELEEYRTDNSDEGSYAPVGHYYYVKGDMCLELPFDNPDVTKHTLITALKFLDVSFLQRSRLVYDGKKNGENSILAVEGKKLAEVHGINNYHKRLGDMGFADKKAGKSKMLPETGEEHQEKKRKM